MMAPKDLLSEAMSKSKRKRKRGLKKRQLKKTSVKIPQELWDRFDEVLPMYGSFTWFVVTAMQNFLDTYTDYPGDALNRSITHISRALTTGQRALIINQPQEQATQVEDKTSAEDQRPKQELKDPYDSLRSLRSRKDPPAW